MKARLLLTWILAVLFLQPTSTQSYAIDSVLNCCEGDVLFLLDSSGSVSSYEFSHMLDFLSELLRPFSLDSGDVRMGLLQVGTHPHLEFGFGAHSNQRSLQEALKGTRQLRGDTNTEAALKLAQESILRPGVAGGAREGLPRVLVWLTDGVQPGDVEAPMAALRQKGVTVLVVSTGHGNYQVLQKVVTPPTDAHLYFVDIDDMSIIANDLRDAIIEIIRAQRLQVRNVTTRSAVLHWQPVLSAGTGFYRIRLEPIQLGVGVEGRPGTSPTTSGRDYIKLQRPGDASHAEITGLLPGTTYRATLSPESNVAVLKSLTVNFTTKSVSLPPVVPTAAPPPPVTPPPVVPSPVSPTSEELGPTAIIVTELGVRSVRVSWGPLQPDLVKTYTVEYGELPQGEVHVFSLGQYNNSTLLTRLQPDTEYLVTVSALHHSGQERGMSVKVCTQEELLPLADLQLTPVGHDSVQVQWQGSVENLRGYWLTWQGGTGQDLATSRYLPRGMMSMLLTRVPRGARVCVSPVYRTARGDGLCCTAHFYSDIIPWGTAP